MRWWLTVSQNKVKKIMQRGGQGETNNSFVPMQREYVSIST